jgi:DNA-directed RNA polymerase sigma subunit (sigma70/sigma32)
MTPDQQLISEIQDNAPSSSDNLIKLIDRHSGIYLEIVNNYIPHDSILIRKADLIDDKEFYIYQAALKYDPDRGTKFSTYLGNETKWMCLNLYNKNKKSPQVPYENEVLESSHYYNTQQDDLDRDSFNKIIDLAKSHPDKRVYKIFNMRYVIGEKNKVMPWQKIGHELNMSIQGCINIHNSAITKFKQKLTKE